MGATGGEQGSLHRPARRLTAAGAEILDEVVAEEVAVALVYNGVSHAVMMATPCDLEDFARGFSLTERIVEKPSEIYDVEVAELERASSGQGGGGRAFEVRLDIASQRMVSLQAQRRTMAGRTGCGLCGVDSLEAALRPVPRSAGTERVSRAAIQRAMAALPGQQKINRANGATHAAGWATGDGTLIAVREDVGRHNALDKLGGALAKAGTDTTGGFVVVTSRCSYEMVQKAAALGAVAIAAVSAPTSLAIETAEQAGIALVAFVRESRLTVYANPERIEP
jgi:FdhD protein